MVVFVTSVVDVRHPGVGGVHAAGIGGPAVHDQQFPVRAMVETRQLVPRGFPPPLHVDPCIPHGVKISPDARTEPTKSMRKWTRTSFRAASASAWRKWSGNLIPEIDERLFGDAFLCASLMSSSMARRHPARAQHFDAVAIHPLPAGDEPADPLELRVGDTVRGLDRFCDPFFLGGRIEKQNGTQQVQNQKPQHGEDDFFQADFYHRDNSGGWCSCPVKISPLCDNRQNTVF
jgi:hypothetical protein